VRSVPKKEKFVILNNDNKESLTPIYSNSHSMTSTT